MHIPLYPRAFTLIELLVVITIIVVLLALLTPALDKAIREANYAYDGSMIKAITTGANVYATSNRQFYPHRAGVQVYGLEPKKIALKGAFDDRVLFKGYIPMEAFQDPFLPREVDWDIFSPGKEQPNALQDYTIISPYTLLFGVNYRDAPRAGPGMMKLGQGFNYDGQESKVMVADMDDLYDNQGWGSHEPDAGPFVAHAGNSTDHASGWTLSRWDYLDMSTRGKLDNLAGFTDGAVNRYKDLVVYDDRLMTIPIHSHSGFEYPFKVTRIPLR